MTSPVDSKKEQRLSAGSFLIILYHSSPERLGLPSDP